MDILFTVLAAVVASISVILIKCGIKRGSLSIGSACFSGISGLIFWGLALYNEQTNVFSAVSGKKLFYSILADLITALAMYCFITALRSGTVTQTVNAWLLRIPLFIAVTVFIIGNKQNITLKLIFASLIAVGAIIVLIGKKSSKTLHFILPALLAPTLTAGSEIITLNHGNCFSSYINYAVVLTGLFIVSLVAMLIENITGNQKKARGDEILFLIAAAVSAVISAFLYCEYVKASTVGSVIKCLTVLFEVAIASLLLKEKFSWKTLCGLLLSTVGILLILFVLGENNLLLIY